MHLNKLKKIFFALTLFNSLNVFNQENREFNISFNLRGKEVTDVNFFFIEGDEAYSLKKIDNKLILAADLPQEFRLLAIYKNHFIIIPINRYNEIKYINIYYDNRIFNNILSKKFQRPLFKYLFRKDYLIDCGLDDVSVTFKPKKTYNLHW